MTSRISETTRARIAAEWDAILGEIRADGMIGKALAKRNISRYQLDGYIADHNGLKAVWNDAKEASADAFSEKALEIALNPILTVTQDQDGNPLPEPLVIKADPSHARNAIDTLKWAAKVRNPRQYSDKSSIDLNVKTVDLTAIIRDANARLAASQAVGRVIEHQAADAALLTAQDGSIEDLL